MKITQNNISIIASTIFIALLVQGCAKKIDHREARNIRGLIYKMNDNEPFTGIIKNEPWGIAAPEPAVGTCEIEFKNGVKDGKTVCKSSDGVKLLESSWDEGKKNGVEKIWELKTGKLSSETHFKAGGRDGLREIYNPYLQVLIERSNWSQNQKSGEQKAWDITGKILLIDLTWVDGKKTGTVRDGNLEENFKDGKWHGVRKTYGLPQSSTNTSLVLGADRELERLGGGAYSYTLFPGNFVESEEMYNDGELIVKPELRQCVDAKRAKDFAVTGDSKVLNDEIRIWSRECEKDNTSITSPAVAPLSPASSKTGACVDAKIAAFRKAEGQDKPIVNDVLQEWEQECTNAR